MKSLILHIGTEKTGTTSIQRALAASREDLAARGILYPRLMDTQNHTEIALLAMGGRPEDPLQLQELARTGLSFEAYRAETINRLDAELAASRAHTTLISNEHCHGRLRDAASVERLHAVLAGRFDQIKTIVYLRRQDRMVVSHHSTRLREGDLADVFPTDPTATPFYNYEKLLSLYADTFGPEAIVPRLFERGRMEAGEVVEDFFKTAGLGVTPRSERFDANVSLSRQQARFLTIFNAKFPLMVDGALNRERGPVMKAIWNTLPGPPARPSRAEAKAFQAQFDQSNARLRERFLPHLDRPTLFDEMFDEYPEESDMKTPLTEDELLAFASALWRTKLN